jgi:hypothetical protein
VIVWLVSLLSFQVFLQNLWKLYFQRRGIISNGWTEEKRKTVNWLGDPRINPDLDNRPFLLVFNMSSICLWDQTLCLLCRELAYLDRRSSNMW